MPALYMDPLCDFLKINPEQLLGKLTSGLANEGFDTTALTTFSWQGEIAELQQAFRTLVGMLQQAARWPVLLEYVLPIVGQRVDCVLLADDVIFVIEYKGGSSSTARAALRQAQEYALNLLDFHEATRNRTVVPIAASGFKTTIPLDLQAQNGGAAVSLRDLPCTILQGHRDLPPEISTR